MTARGSGASYIVTSVSRVVAATFTVLTVYIDSDIFYPGLRGQNGVDYQYHKVQPSRAEKGDTSTMTSFILRLHSFNYYGNIEHIP